MDTNSDGNIKNGFLGRFPLISFRLPYNIVDNLCHTRIFFPIFPGFLCLYLVQWCYPYVHKRMYGVMQVTKYQHTKIKQKIMAWFDNNWNFIIIICLLPQKTNQKKNTEKLYRKTPTKVKKISKKNVKKNIENKKGNQTT